MSGSLDQAVSVAFDKARQFMRSHPWTAKRVKEFATELVFTETLVDARTGGRTRVDHIMRALPSRKPAALHGRNANLTIFTEGWSLTYPLLEALAPAPTRRAPRRLYASYAGLKSQAKPGNVLFDLSQRQQVGDPALFVADLHGPDAWRQVLWINQNSSTPSAAASNMCRADFGDCGKTNGPLPTMIQRDS